MSSSNGPIQMRGLSVIAGLSMGSRYDELAIANPNSKAVFKLENPKDLTINAGDICFEFKSSNDHDPTSYLMSVFNGIQVEDSVVDEDEMVEALAKQIIFRGISIKRCVWDTENPIFTEEPVVTNSGLIRMQNTSRHIIFPGDVIVPTIPYPGNDPIIRGMDPAFSKTRQPAHSTPLREIMKNPLKANKLKPTIQNILDDESRTLRYAVRNGYDQAVSNVVTKTNAAKAAADVANAAANAAKTAADIAAATGAPVTAKTDAANAADIAANAADIAANAADIAANAAAAFSTSYDHRNDCDNFIDTLFNRITTDRLLEEMSKMIMDSAMSSVGVSQSLAKSGEYFEIIAAPGTVFQASKM